MIKSSTDFKEISPCSVWYHLKPLCCQFPKYFKLMWLPNLLTLNEPDEGYSWNASFTLSLISMCLLLSMGRYICWWTSNPLWSLASFLIFADHRATDFTLSKTFKIAQWKCCAAFLQIFVMKSGARTIKHIYFASFNNYLHSSILTYLLIFISSSLS
jgi:hypothetical protein